MLVYYLKRTNMIIKSVKLNRFKCFGTATFEFQPGVNTVKGKNGSGKSAIKDAIVFVLYNRLIDGSNQNVDTLIKRGEVSASVEVAIAEKGTLRRIRSDRASKLFYLDGSQSTENAAVAQRDIEKTIIPDPEDFLAVFSPGYFMGLEMEERREYAKKFLKPIDRMALFESLGGTKQSLSEFGMDLDDPEECLKIAREEKKLAEKEKEAALNTIEFLRKNLQELGITNTKEELLEEMKIVFEKKTLRKAWDEFFIKKESIIPFEKALSEKKLRLEELDAQLKKIEDPIAPSRDVASRLEGAMRAITIHSVPSENECPKCFQQIPEEHKKRLSEAAAIEKKKRDAIEKEYYDQLELHVEATKKYNKEVNDILNIRADAERLRKDIASSSLPTILPPSQMQPEETLEWLENRDKFLDKVIQKLEQMFELDEKASKAHDQWLAADHLVNIFKATGLPSLELEERIAPLNEALQAAIPGAKFVLLKATKNGMEFKNVFDIEIDERPYARLSSGEKKLVDVSLSIIFNSLLKEPGIIFIDDADLVDAGGIRALLEMTKDLQVFVTLVEEEPITITNT